MAIENLRTKVAEPGETGLIGFYLTSNNSGSLGFSPPSRWFTFINIGAKKHLSYQPFLADRAKGNTTLVAMESQTSDPTRKNVDMR